MVTASKRHKASNKQGHKNPKHFVKPGWPYILTAVTGVVLIILGISYVSYSRSVLSFSADPYPIGNIFQKTGFPVKIEIPSVGISQTVYEALIKNGVWQTSDAGATHLMVSAVPGQKGNIIIYGHNKQSIFGQLKQVRTGNSIIITTDSGNKYYYKVGNINTVTPDNLDPVKPTASEILTVYTCTGFLDSKRLVIRADPVLLPLVNPFP